MDKIIIANWKMNPDSPEKAERLVKEIVRGVKKPGGVEVVIAPPFVFLDPVAKVLKAKSYKLKAKVGVQDVFWERKGAYTGEVSPSQLKSLGASYVIVGHSERRALGETDEMINRKVKAALKEGLKVILCVGEPWSVRKKGLAAAKRFVRNQLTKNLSDVRSQMSDVIIAYEPVWAIGTGLADKPSDTVALVNFIKEFLKTTSDKLKTKVLYGGSVTSKNAKSFLNQKAIDGALVGGASLKASEFTKIIEAAR